MISNLVLLVALLAQVPASAPVAAAPAAGDARLVKIGDLADVQGIRENALYGVGVVVGLAKTGDKSAASLTALANLLEKYSLDVKPADLSRDSIALVAVTATLPPFGRAGDKIDIHISSIGGATSLFGGTLLFTPLNGADERVYAVAQGPVTIGGFSAEGASASVSQNHTTVAFISGGATLEEDVDTRYLAADKTYSLRLRQPDFTTASRVADAVNSTFRDAAVAVDPSQIRIRVPEDVGQDDLVRFVARVGDLSVLPHVIAKVIVNERTGTIVAGEAVKIRRVAIAHGNLTVTIAETPEVSQPQPLSRGVTTVVPRTDIDANVDAAHGIGILPDTGTIGELAQALNALGAAPRDLITILQMLRQAGALEAELEIR